MSKVSLAGGWRRAVATTMTTALALTGMAVVGPVAADAAPLPLPARASLADGKQHRIEFDKYSFKIDGERINVYSGEFHYWRLPSPEAWRDVLQKIKGAGFNAVSLYFFWGLHQSEENGPFDFTGIRDIDLLLRICEEEGLYVIARPGPYINAEVSMGGLPAYMSNVGGGSLRTLEHPQVVEASKRWLSEFNKIASKHQLTDGGGSIFLYQVENELPNDAKRYGDFLAELVKSVKADGINVPLFHNDWGYGGRFKDTERYGTDFYASDIYPLHFNCGAGRGQLPDNERAFRGFAANSPHFIAETQGGAFTPWGANFNTEQCAVFADEAFTRQWSVMGMANGVTAFSYYMTHGGTNWGWTGAPASGFTSYDYGAALNEARTITPKLAAQKEAGYFHKALPSLAAMDPVAAPPVADVVGGNVKSYMRLAADGDSASAPRFVAYRLADSNATQDTTFTSSLWLDGEPPATVNLLVDDRAAGIDYAGDWEEAEDSTAAEGTLKLASAAGATATFTFTGTGIRYLSATGTDFGKAEVRVDEGTPEVVTGHVDSDQNKPAQQVLFQRSGLTPGQHTITVRALGEAAEGGTGTRISVDAFEVVGAPNPDAPQVHNDTSGFVTFKGSWQVGQGQSWTRGDIGGDETYSPNRGDSYEFTFDGVGFDLIGPFSGNHGPAEVYIDDSDAPVGRTEERVTGSATPQQVVFSKHDLSPGQHKVRVVVTGERFPGSSGSYVSLDAVRVYPTAASLPNAGGGRTGWGRVPQFEDTKLRLHGRDALALAANFPVGKQRVGYTTAQLFGEPQPVSDGLVQYLMGVEGDPAEIVLYAKESETRLELPSGVRHRWNAAKDQLLIGWTTGAEPQDITVNVGGQRTTFRAISRGYAANVWQTDADGDVVSVEGATLVRGARVADGKLHLTGSMSAPGNLKVLSRLAEWTWNGVGTTGAVPGPVAQTAPELSWRTTVGAPEAMPGFDVSGWRVADSKSAENHRQGPGPSAGVVLDSNHYGFYEGDVWYRASYVAESNTIVLTGNGGSGVPGHGKDPAFGQVWANGKYVGSFAAKGRPVPMQLPVAAGEQVELAVLVHNLGQNLDWSDDGLSRQNRGLYDARLSARGDVVWRIQGAQGKTSPADKERGMYNSGGLYGERAGWYLPEYPISDWAPATGFAAEAAGVNWYATDFELAVPEGQDQAYQVQITPRGGIGRDGSQVTIFVNGWNTGVYIGDIGPQTNFTIPTQFLNLRGKNRLTLAVAAKEPGMGPEAVRVVPTAATTGSVIAKQLDAPAYPERKLTGSLSATKVQPGAEVSADVSLAELNLAAGERVKLTVNWGEAGAAVADLKHIYPGKGRFDVVAEARDAVSGQLLASTQLGTVEVGEGSPAPTPTLSASPELKGRSVKVGEKVSVRLTLRGVDADEADVRFRVDWGDSAALGRTTQAIDSEELSHTYAVAGRYRVRASALVRGQLVAEADLGELTVVAADPSEPRPSEPKPSEPRPSEPKPSEPKPSEPKPSEPRPSEPKPSEPRPSEPRPSEPRPSEPKPAPVPSVKPTPKRPGLPKTGR